MITKVIGLLKGRKTYIVAAVGIVYALLTGDEALLVESVLAITLRAGIAKN